MHTTQQWQIRRSASTVLLQNDDTFNEVMWTLEARLKDSNLDAKAAENMSIRVFLLSLLLPILQCTFAVQQPQNRGQYG